VSPRRRAPLLAIVRATDDRRRVSRRSCFRLMIDRAGTKSHAIRKRFSIGEKGEERREYLSLSLSLFLSLLSLSATNFPAQDTSRPGSIVKNSAAYRYGGAGEAREDYPVDRCGRAAGLKRFARTRGTRLARGARSRVVPSPCAPVCLLSTPLFSRSRGIEDFRHGCWK